jgi:hygromycin-B 7''-O-kinase
MADEVNDNLAASYSKRLGPIHDDQFRAALRRFDLGDFVRAAPTLSGMFGQSVFVNAASGEFVLRGGPHDAAQFPKEKFFACALHERTTVPVPWPYLYEPKTDIFGWPFVVMPRLPGLSASQDQGPADNVAIARAVGSNLARAQALKFDAAGAFEVDIDAIKPYPNGYEAWVKTHMDERMEEGRRFGCITDDDEKFVQDVLARGDGLWDGVWQPCFVQNDYGLCNLFVQKSEQEWRVSGLFDLHECSSGDGESDLIRTLNMYLGNNPPNGAMAARAFIDAYSQEKPLRPGYNERHSIYSLSTLMTFWLFGHSQAKWFPDDMTLRSCCENRPPDGLDARLAEADRKANN